MTGAVTRRDFLEGGVAMFGIAGTQRPTAAATEIENAPSRERATARYIAKHAARRADVYEQFRVRYRMPDQGDIKDLFERTTETSLREALVGLFDEIFLGGSVGFVETVAWYERAEETSGMYRTLERGPHPNESGERYQAAEINRNFRENAAKTAEEARKHAEELSETSRDALLKALETEHKAATSSEIQQTIGPWVEMDTNEISGGGEAVRNMARQNYRAIRATASLAETHAEAIRGEADLFFIDVLTAYRRNRDEVTPQIPGFLVNALGNERFNLYIVDDPSQKEPRAARRIFYIKTSGSRLDRYELVGSDDANLHVFTTVETMNEIATAAAPLERLRTALDNDEMTYETRGLITSIKYGIFGIFDGLLG